MHEPKGVSTASLGQVYVAGGTGSGTWKKVPLSSLDGGSIEEVGTTLEINLSGGVEAVKRLYRYNINVGILSAVAANTTAEQIITVFGVSTATDDVLRIVKPTHQAGLLIGNARVTADNQITVQYANLTGSSITPTASESYIFYVWRNG